MKYIRKGKEPRSLKTYRSTPNANFDDINKEEIRSALLDEQGYLCAYCMQRISQERGRQFTNIEHYRSQHRHPKLALNFQNMLGVCTGNEGNPKHLLHCDKRKALYDNSVDLTVNPIDIRCEKAIQYLKDGTIYSNESRINKDLQETLSLNEQKLKENRRMAIKKALQNINAQQVKAGRRNKAWILAIILKEKSRWEKRDKLNKYTPYCQAVIFVLEKKIAQLEKK